ncbi:MAG: GerMN domain-containing protein, partial [Acidimicrobiia bacterium]|nr:GerMN domain-containing protein [Acidimicrobiia bacterium]
SIHEPNINIIATNGISIGFKDGTYRPALPVTRGQMATFLTRALGLIPIVPPVPVPTTVYLFMDTLGDDPLGQGPFLVPVNRQIAETTMPATATMWQLLAGPTSAEEASRPAIPDATELLGLAIFDGIATVDLSGAYASGGGSASMLGRVAQVVFTLTQYSTIDAVNFELDGAPIDVLGGEGIILDDYNTREELFDQLPLVFVDRPSYRGQATNPMRIRGWTSAFEATFNVAIVDADGLIRTEQAVTAGGDQIVIPNGPVWTAFDVDVPYTVDAEQVGALITWADSAKDGSPQGVREYPVSLVPAG